MFLRVAFASAFVFATCLGCQTARAPAASSVKDVTGALDLTGKTYTSPGGAQITFLSEIQAKFTDSDGSHLTGSYWLRDDGTLEIDGSSGGVGASVSFTSVDGWLSMDTVDANGNGVHFSQGSGAGTQCQDLGPNECVSPCAWVAGFPGFCIGNNVGGGGVTVTCATDFMTFTITPTGSGIPDVTVLQGSFSQTMSHYQTSQGRELYNASGAGGTILRIGVTPSDLSSIVFVTGSGAPISSVACSNN